MEPWSKTTQNHREFPELSSMLLSRFYLLVAVGAIAEASYHPLAYPFFGIGSIERIQDAVLNEPVSRSVEETLKRDLSKLPRRRKRHLYGASRERGSWRRLLSGTESTIDQHHAASRTMDVVIDAFGDRLLATTDLSLQTCQEAIPLEESVGTEFGTVCRCVTDLEELTATLECHDSQCTYCNSAETVCTGYTYGVKFNRNGEDFEYYEQDDYRIGRQGSIRYTEADETCSVSIGGTECSQCNMHDCSDGFYGVDVSCGNIEEGAVYNSCDDAFSSTGVFEAYNENEFEKCYGNLDICRMGRSSLDTRFECFCDNSPDSLDTSLMTCGDKCEYCNSFISVCGRESYEQIFENATSIGSRRTIQYTHGRSELVEYEESKCDSPTGCQNCAVKVDGVACSSCTIKTCANGTRAPLIECSNADSSISDAVDLCAPVSLSNTVLEFFEPGFTDSCISTQETACREAKNKYEQHAQKYVCNCVDQDNGSTELQCQATCGDLCNDEETVCVRESFMQDFVDQGGSSYFRKDIKYTRGRKETLSYVEFLNGDCSMKIDGVGCRSCAINTCEGNPQVEKAPLIDCSDFEGGAILDLCETEVRVETGIFERFSIEEFHECLDRTPANGICQSSVAVTNVPFQASGSTLMVTYDNVKSCGSVQSFAPGLWYTVIGTGKGIEASVCDPKADFNVQISVYTGSGCGNLTCATASDNSCKLDWMAEEDTKYFIRVHGTGGQIGNFDLSIGEVNYGSSVCETNKDAYERNPDLETSCRDCTAPDADGHVRLFCSVECSTCDESGSICTDQHIATKFDKAGHIAVQKHHYKYISGRHENVTVTSFNCTEPGICQACEVAINNSTCKSCEVVDCSQGETKGIVATCGSTTIKTCDEPALDSAGVLRPLVDTSYGSCYSRNATTSCLDHEAFEEDLESGIVCECESVGEKGDTRLLCRHQSCLHCNTERNICGYDAFGAVFDGELGRLRDRFEGFQYIQGRNDLIIYQISNNVTQIDGTCSMSVNNETCDHCVVTKCNTTREEERGPFHGISFDCQNIPSGLFYDGCSSIALPETFEFITSTDYNDCVAVASPKEACQSILLETMVARRSNQEDVCNCTLSSETGYYELVCTDPELCHFCSDDSATAACADSTERRVELNHFGSSIARIESYQWVSGRDEVLVLRDTDVECQVTVDGEVCSSCTHTTECSTTDVRGLSIDCSNVLGVNATFECGKGHEIFLPLSDSALYICPSDDTSAPSAESTTTRPTVSPTASPTRTMTMPPQISLVMTPAKSEASYYRIPFVAAAAAFAMSMMLGVVLL